MIPVSLTTGAPTLGTPNLTAVYLLTAVGLAAGAPRIGAPVVARGPVVFPLRPNRPSSPYTLRRAFRTEILAGRAGREQRRALRGQPRQEVEFPLTLADDCRRRFERLMTAAQRQPVLIAARPFAVALPSGMAAGAVADLGAPPPVWVAAGARLLLTDGARQEPRTVASVAGNTVTFTAAALDAWPPGSRLTPALNCRLAEKIAANRVSPRGVIEVTIRADAEPGWSLADEAEGAAAATFDGREVVVAQPDRWLAVTADFDQARERIDSGFGVFADFHPVAYAARLWQAQYTACGQAEALALRQLTARMKGMRGEFFMPTFVSDLVPAAQADAGTSTLRVAGAAIAEDYGADPVHRSIAVRLPSGAWHFAKIASMAADGAATVITLAAAWPVTIPVTARISWLPLRRFASDTFQEDWQGRSARVTLAIMTLDYVEAEAP